MSKLTTTGARRLLDHIVVTASVDNGKPVAICIVDADGNQLAATTMAGAKNASTDYALCKAITAIQWARDTIEFHYQKQDDGT